MQNSPQIFVLGCFNHVDVYILSVAAASDARSVFSVGQKACRELEDSERLLETLQADVSALRRKLREKKQSEAGKGSNCVFMCETFTKSSFYGCMFFTMCIFVASAASVQDPPEPKNNLLLQEAVRALFGSCPLFHTQTLTLEAFPVPDVSHSPERNASAAAPLHLDAAGDQETLPLLRPNMTNLRKRPKEMHQVRERKRRKSSS